MGIINARDNNSEIIHILYIIYLVKSFQIFRPYPRAVVNGVPSLPARKLNTMPSVVQCVAFTQSINNLFVTQFLCQ